MSEAYQAVVGGEQQVVVGTAGGGGGGLLPFYHVPQQSRREKLRYPPCTDDPPPPSSTTSLHHQHHHLPSSYDHNPSSIFMGASPSPLLPPSSSSSFHLLNPSYSSPGAQFDPPQPQQASSFLDHQYHFFPHHPVSLSLSSSSYYHHHNAFDPTLTARNIPPPIDQRPAVGGGSMATTTPSAAMAPATAASRGPAPAEPFTGYAAVLKGSRYLHPAQQMLDEICDVGTGAMMVSTDVDSSGLNDPEALSGADLGMDGSTSNAGGGGGFTAADGLVGGERRRMKTSLISMLDEVYRRYKQYYQQIQAVITSFESVAGLGNAAPYKSIALNSMTKHFRCLKNAISDQLRFTEKALGKEGHSKDDFSGIGLLSGGVCFQGAGAHTSAAIGQPNVWRPQRGLPERAVAVLKAWLFEHFLHPYPTDADKHMLAKQTGLSRNQVSNWFINARVRLWKPLVEEIHSLEMRQARKAAPEADNNHGSNGQSQLPISSGNPQSSKQPSRNINLGKNQDHQHKRFRNELMEIPHHMDQEHINFSINEFSDHRLGGGAAITNSGNGGVSLTLGLHQNNAMCLSETLPFSIARRFGIEDSSTSYGMGGLDVQDRHLRKGIDGQLLRDFGG